MNAVEIEEAVSALVEQPFDPDEFPYAFLAAFGNKETTLKRLRSGVTNKSDVVGGVLQRINIHLAVCDPGTVEATLPALRESSATANQKAKYILATDGTTVEAENMEDGETLACSYTELADHFGFLLPLAGITTVKQIRENAFDIKATGRLNKLYIELLKANPDWEERREELNHFFARLIFCFFAEDTGIFNEDLFTTTVGNMSEANSSNTHEIIAELFKAMNTQRDEREGAGIRNWARPFPYVNGGLFSGSLDVPRFTKMARSYLLHIGGLDWKQINPDIFGSMIQAVAEDEERGELGMHYTSVPNILKVLNPLFLDELREKLEEAGDGSDQGSKRKLLNIRNRIARIRVFDPACGSGNFLVIAYKHMREIEAEINRRRGEPDRPTDIPLTNFRGIEIRHFAAEIARLALIIAEYQCDVLYRGQKLALAEFLPLEAANWITNGNALQLDWLALCPPSGIGSTLASRDLLPPDRDNDHIGFDNEGGEVYICGNPPYLGSRRQDKSHKLDLRAIAAPLEPKWRSLDYVSGWLILASQYQRTHPCIFAFVTTSSLCEGLHVSILWKHILNTNTSVNFAHRPFRWGNLAKQNAGVSVVIVGVSNIPRPNKRLFSETDEIAASHINAYLTNAADVFVGTQSKHIADARRMLTGAMPRDGGHLLLKTIDMLGILRDYPHATAWMRRYVGSDELIKGRIRYCLWIDDADAHDAESIPAIAFKLNNVRRIRSQSDLSSTRQFADRPHRFVYLAGQSRQMTVAVGAVSSEHRAYLPTDCLTSNTVCSNRVYAMYDGELSDFAVLSSKMHHAWVCSVCGRLEQRLSYSNTLGWNTFPVPPLTEQNRADLSRCAENILLARESHWPATIADMYDPDEMDRKYPDLRAAHEANDETLERIYIGRRFKNDTERLEKLFAMYTEMIEREKAGKPSKKKTTGRK